MTRFLCGHRFVGAAYYRYLYYTKFFRLCTGTITDGSRGRVVSIINLHQAAKYFDLEEAS